MPWAKLSHPFGVKTADRLLRVSTEHPAAHFGTGSGSHFGFSAAGNVFAAGTL